VARYETAAAIPSLATLERLLASCGQRLVLDSAPAPERRALNESVVRKHRRALLALAARHGARNVRIFGSTARGEAKPESDVDLLVDLEPGRTLLDLVGLGREAGKLLGRPVDVATEDMLRDRIRSDVDHDAVPV
jgi:predicted nucleotidyltransferase